MIVENLSFVILVLFCLIVTALVVAQVRVMLLLNKELHKSRDQGVVKDTGNVVTPLLVSHAANDVTEKWKETLPKQSTRIKNRNKRKRK